MRALSNFRTGFPNQLGHISNHAATMAEVLRDEGFATFAVGKWHLCQMENASAAGPYDQWPCQRGFDRFYGFLDGETDQFAPDLVYDNHSIPAPATAAEGYHLSEDLVDHAIGFIHDTTSIRPDRPFFTYLAFGATHAPHQAPPDYMAKYRGRFDGGWDEARAEWFARQVELGLLPEGTELAPRNPGVVAWADLPDNDRRLAIRLQEAFAAFLDHTDAQIGRLVDELEALGQLDNTLIFVLSDNGASQEGGPFGVMHEMKSSTSSSRRRTRRWSASTTSVGPTATRTTRGVGPRPATRRSAGTSRTRTRAASTSRSSCTGRPGGHERGRHPQPVPLRQRPGPDRLRGRRGRATRDLPRVRADAGVGHVDGLHVRCAGGGHPQARAVLRDVRPPGHPRRRVEGGDPPREGRLLRRRPVGALPRGRGRVGVPRPGRRAARPAAADDRSAGGPRPRRTACCRSTTAPIELFGVRFRDRSPHPASRRYTYRPPLAPMPAQVGASLGGRGWIMAAEIDRPAGAGGVLFATGHRELRAQLLRRRTTTWCSTTTTSASTRSWCRIARCRSGRPVVGVRFDRAGVGGRGHA